MKETCVLSKMARQEVIAAWGYPMVSLTVWLMVGALTLVELSTVGPSLRASSISRPPQVDSAAATSCAMRTGSPSKSTPIKTCPSRHGRMSWN
jgi:hypothetical protein